MLAPILAFTADEAWEFIPGNHERSVHSSVWETTGFELTEQERELWSRLFGERELVLAELEKARQNKLIGKALEAKVVLTCAAESHARFASVADDLRELLNVSELELRSGAEDAVAIERAGGRKCERCWHWETDLGSDPDHPALCGRCVQAVSGRV
jgi:isoleucyl-tRNA synthetase